MVQVKLNNMPLEALTALSNIAFHKRQFFLVFPVQ